MKVAVASEDGVAVSRHFSRSTCFLVYEIRANLIRGEESRVGVAEVTPYCESGGREVAAQSRQSYDRFVEAVEDCQVVLCRGMSWRVASELIRRGVNPMVISGELSPREAVEHYLAGTLRPAAGFCRRKKWPNQDPGTAGEESCDDNRDR